MKELEKKAQDFIEGGGHFDYISRRVGTFIIFRETPDDPMSVAYKCPQCDHEETAVLELSKPYTLICSACDALIFKQEKVKGKRKAKKKKA